MMTIKETLAAINGANLTIRVTGGNISAIGDVPDRLLPALKEHRAALIAVFGDPLAQRVLGHFDGRIVDVT
jgi:hypothetical protein